MTDFLYRFRPLEKFLGKGELESQEIFFASPSDLNDPVEGYLDIFWKGDQIVWKNLFKNYLICLEYVYILTLIGGKDFVLTDDDILVFLTSGKLSTKIHRDRFEKICSEFFKHKHIKKLIKNLGLKTKEIRRDEFLFYLKIIHPLALAAISSIEKTMPLKIDEKIVRKQSELLEKVTNEKFLKSFDSEDNMSNFINTGAAFNIGQSINNQLDFIRTYKTPGLLENKNKLFVFFEFPSRYVQQLEQLIYPPWYTACFVEDVSNASLWGYYGKSHEGVCLKFKTTKMTENQVGLNLESITGYSGSKNGDLRKIKSYQIFPFYKISYSDKYPSIDFFRSIGRLPIPDLEKYWYLDEKGNLSSCASDILQNKDKWRKQYWQTFYKSNTVKLEEWKHEAEHRLILSSSLSNLIDEEDRLLKYRFSDLDGIIFGIKTPPEAKLRIYKTVERKCDENKYYDIKFYQSSYSHFSGKMEVNELVMLRLPLNTLKP